MYQDYDYHDMAREVQENLAKIYAESFEDQESFDAGKSDETYGKIQAILKCPEMEKCHPFLYSLDMENVNETDTEKVNKIYDLGVDRGIIVKEDSEEENKNVDGIITQECDDQECGNDGICGGPDDSLTDQEMTTNKLDPVPMDTPDIKKPIYTILYSGMKEGDLKMGEFYSMASSTEGAKEDCIAQLTGQGYSNISIMAVEQTTPSYGDIASIDNSTPSKDTDGDDVDVGVEDVYNEDDSEEFEKQETGDKENDAENTEEVKEPEENTQTDNVENGENDEVEKTDVDNTENKEDAENKEDSENTEEVKDDDSEEDVDNGEDTNDSEDEKENIENNGENEEKEKLTAEQKAIMKDDYTKIFKEVLKKTELEKSVSDMTLQERTDFYQKLSEKWTKNDPSDFMTDKEQEKLNNTVVKVN